MRNDIVGLLLREIVLPGRHCGASPALTNGLQQFRVWLVLDLFISEICVRRLKRHTHRPVTLTLRFVTHLAVLLRYLFPFVFVPTRTQKIIPLDGSRTISFGISDTSIYTTNLIY